MNTPPLLLGAAILFWGWQAGLLPFALVMAAVLEGSRLAKARWEFSQTDLDRIWNLCTLLFLATALYALTSSDGAKAWAGVMKQNTPGNRVQALTNSARSVFLFFQWMPLTFFPMAAAQAFSQRAQINLSTFSWWLRRKRQTREAGFGERGINLGYPYFAVCVLAASAAKARSPWFFAGLGLLIGWALWRGRARGYSRATWAACLVVAVGLGFLTQVGLVYLQAVVQRLDTALMMRWSRAREFDVNETRTHLGAVGRLKLSGQIVMRIKASNQPPPALVREASYDYFRSPLWLASSRGFSMLLEETNETTWLLLTNPSPRRAVTIAQFLDGGKGVLALPPGAAQLDELRVFGLERNRFGTVRSIGGPGFVEFQARYDTGAFMDSPPDTNDFSVPMSETNVVAQIAIALDLTNRTPEQVLGTLSAFFGRQFEYATWVDRRHSLATNETAIGRFLLHDRKGHCEYFATATALLLRHAGIPARYAVGYAVQEHKGGEYIVRARHAHAWCLAWVNGAWREIDNTPGVWHQVEADRASFWEPLGDFWSKAWFGFSRFRWGKTELRQYVIWLIVPPLLLVAARLAFARQWRRARAQARAKRLGPPQPGLDSEFYAVEQRLAALGLDRRPEETLTAWLARVIGDGRVDAAPLEPALRLHYRLRFDPEGITADERAALRQHVASWLQTHAAKAGAR